MKEVFELGTYFQAKLFCALFCCYRCVGSWKAMAGGANASAEAPQVASGAWPKERLQQALQLQCSLLVVRRSKVSATFYFCQPPGWFEPRKRLLLLVNAYAPDQRWAAAEAKRKLCLSRAT